MHEFLHQASHHLDSIAIISESDKYTYGTLLKRSHSLASTILAETSDLLEVRIAYMVSPGFNYVVTQWAIWQSGGIAVPLCISHPQPSLQYTIEDSQAEIIILEKQYAEILTPLIATDRYRVIILDELSFNTFPKELPLIDAHRKAMILYTSGTTNKPKGVVTTHHCISTQIKTLVEAWQWTFGDQILCVLPLHHVHGIINVVSCALWSGARVQFITNFDAQKVFDIFLQGHVNVFMAVPTIYFKLISRYESLLPGDQHKITKALSSFRLMVSGSAALPISVMEKWKSISNHTLLERYGMTEIGMGISNPYLGERKAGYIGVPLPGVQVRLVNDQNIEVQNPEPGEIQIKGDNVFKEYWHRPDATVSAFTPDGWFKTGDIAVIENGYYRILGRDSVDIIKSGGYKISALEIEEAVREYTDIKDCSVVGIPDEEWGEIVAAVLIVNESFNLDELKSSLKSKLPGYKLPRIYKIVDELPRNAMGKVTKNDLKKLVE